MLSTSGETSSSLLRDTRVEYVCVWVCVCEGMHVCEGVRVCEGVSVRVCECEGVCV